MEEGFLGSALGKPPPIPLRLSLVPPALQPTLSFGTGQARGGPTPLRGPHSQEIMKSQLPAQESTGGTPQPVGLSWPAQKGRGSPSLKLAGQLVQDLHGLPVVFQLGIHQGRELAHLLNLQATSQS